MMKQQTTILSLFLTLLLLYPTTTSAASIAFSKKLWFFGDARPQAKGWLYANLKKAAEMIEQDEEDHEFAVETDEDVTERSSFGRFLSDGFRKKRKTRPRWQAKDDHWLDEDEEPTTDYEEDPWHEEFDPDWKDGYDHSDKDYWKGRHAYNGCLPKGRKWSPRGKRRGKSCGFDFYFGKRCGDGHGNRYYCRRPWKQRPAVPEPSSLWLVAMSLGAARRRRSRD